MAVVLTALLVLGLDLLTKWVVQTRMELYESIPIIPGIFHLTYVLNPGAAFGIFREQRTLFIIVSVVAIGVILYYAFQFHRRGGRGYLPLGLGLMLGGAVGNLVDRMRYGKVVDFLDFRVWPVFNVADSAITIGVGLLILYLFREGATDRKAR